MKIKLSGMSGKHGAAFADVIDRAAREAGVSDDQMLFYMSHFIEALADDVARGHIVTVPGFGKFAACYFKHHRNQPHSMQPRFSPAVGFVQQTKLCAPVSTAGNTALKYHKINHHLSTRRISARVMTATEGIRESIRRQMAQD